MTQTQARRTPAPSRARLTLDDLSAMSNAELDALYRSGRVPADMTALDHKPKGRMVSIRGVSDTALSRLIVPISKLGAFPWDGKSLTSTGTLTSDGINRIGIGRRFNLFPFKTRIETSVIDGEPTIYLDYEQPGNPFFIRKIRDELREVAPKLFLGPAMWKTGPNSAQLVLWFALDGNA